MSTGSPQSLLLGIGAATPVLAEFHLCANIHDARL
jgi:hypothetical protein